MTRAECHLGTKEAKDSQEVSDSISANCCSLMKECFKMKEVVQKRQP